MPDKTDTKLDLGGLPMEKLTPSTEPDGSEALVTGDPADRPRKPYGLTEPLDETSESTNRTEGVNQGGEECDEAAYVDKDLLKSRTL